MSLESEFKLFVEVCVFSESLNYFNHWTEQVKYINQYWDKVVDEIDMLVLNEVILKSAKELNLNDEKFDFPKALKRCKTDWRVEMMTNVAHIITQYNDDELPEDECCVKWSGTEMIYTKKNMMTQQ